MSKYYIKKVTSKKNWLVFVLLLLTCVTKSQTINVSNFYCAETDLTANHPQTSYLDHNGDVCALIRVQTTQKKFTFDVGVMGVQKQDETHTGEIWVYVPHGVRHISIRHEILGTLPNYDFPSRIDKGRTYIMTISSDKVFINNYDDTRKQKIEINIEPVKSKFTLNGMLVKLNEHGKAEQELSFGTYTYKVESEGYYPKEGQFTIDDLDKKQKLEISDLLPMMGKLSIHKNPPLADVYIDGVRQTKSSIIEPYELQVGNHEVTVSLNGYKAEKRNIVIEENKTTDIQVSLSQVASFLFKTIPAGALITVGNEIIGRTPCSKELTSGNYQIKAQSKGYKDYYKRMTLNSSTPDVNLTLKRILNHENELYIEGSYKTGAFMGFGLTLGGFIHNINIEAAALYSASKSKTIYWNAPDPELEPIPCSYSPEMTISGKLGYGIPIGTRFRLTPQVGFNYLKLKETRLNDYAYKIANGANVGSALLSLRLSTAITRHFAISLSPEYAFAIMKSKGYSAISEVSSEIKKWSEGINVKLGIALYF